jgi:hypothetical protein
MTKARRIVTALLLSLIAGAAVGAQILRPPQPEYLPLESMPENDDIRSRWMEGLLEAPRDRALMFRTRRETNASGVWRLEVIRGPKAFYTAIVPDRTELYGQGAWIVKRNLADGAFVQAKVFLRNDPNTFLRLYPFGERSKLDLVLYRGVVRRDVILPVPFRKLNGVFAGRHHRLDRRLRGLGAPVPVPGLYETYAS